MDFNIFYSLGITFMVVLLSYVIKKLADEKNIKEENLKEYKQIFDFVLNIIKDTDKTHMKEIEVIIYIVNKCYNFADKSMNMSELELEDYLYDEVFELCKLKNIKLNEFRLNIIKKVIELKIQNKSITEMLKILSSIQK